MRSCALLLSFVLLVAPGAAAWAQPAKIPDTLEQRVLACAICHGKQGEGILKNEYYPRLAGKPAGYLYNQLVNFRERRRDVPIMTYMVAYPVRSLSPRDSRVLRQPAAAVSGAGGGRAEGVARARRGVGHEGRSVAGRARLRGLSRQGAHRHGAGDPRAHRPAPRLRCRADGKLEGRAAQVGGTGLYGAGRLAPDAGGHRRGQRLARDAARRLRRAAGAGRLAQAAARMRRRAVTASEGGSQ